MEKVQKVHKRTETDNDGRTIIHWSFKISRSIGHAKMGGQNQSARSIETQLETLLLVLNHPNRTLSFHFKCVSIKSYCNGAFVV